MVDPAHRTPIRWLFTLAAPLALMACGGGEDEPAAYEADVTDESGGELIVSDADAEGVEDVTVPETAMTPVPPEPAPAPDASPAPAAE